MKYLEDKTTINGDYLSTSFESREREIRDYILKSLKESDYLCDIDGQVGMLSLWATEKGCKVLANFLAIEEYQNIKDNLYQMNPSSSLQILCMSKQNFI